MVAITDLDFILPPLLRQLFHQIVDLSRTQLSLSAISLNPPCSGHFECNGDVSTASSHRSGRYSCPARKLPVLGGHFHLFPLFDEEGNADFQAGL